MATLEELERKLMQGQRRNRAAGRIGVLIVSLLGLLLGAAVGGFKWFVIWGIAAGAAAWLLGSNDPRAVALIWGGVGAALGAIYGAVFIWGEIS